MIRKRKTKSPCQGCFLHPERCICSILQPIETRAKLTLIIHAKELKRTTNTGRLAVKALHNSEMLVRGLDQQKLDLSFHLTPHFRPLLLTPSEDATELTEDLVRSFQHPIQLLVPDGNWRQASKVSLRHPELDGVPRVKLKRENQLDRVLRRESKEEGMATLEAIAQAFRIFEGEAAYQHLINIYQAKLENTLKGRPRSLLPSTDEAANPF